MDVETTTTMSDPKAVDSIGEQVLNGAFLLLVLFVSLGSGHSFTGNILEVALTQNPKEAVVRNDETLGAGEPSDGIQQANETELVPLTTVETDVHPMEVSTSSQASNGPGESVLVSTDKNARTSGPLAMVGESLAYSVFPASSNLCSPTKFVRRFFAP